MYRQMPAQLRACAKDEPWPSRSSLMRDAADEIDRLMDALEAAPEEAASDPTGGTDPNSCDGLQSTRTPEQIREAVTDSMQRAWDSFVADTGCYPDCFTHEGRDRFSAAFWRGNFASMVTDNLVAALAEAGLTISPTGALRRQRRSEEGMALTQPDEQETAPALSPEHVIHNGIEYVVDDEIERCEDEDGIWDGSIHVCLRPAAAAGGDTTRPDTDAEEALVRERGEWIDDPERES